MRYLLLFFSLVLVQLACQAQSFEGTWQGDLSVQGMTLPFVVHLQKSGEGYTAKADSPKQNAFDLLADAKVLGDSIVVKVTIGAEIRGRMTNDTTIVSTFYQGGMQLPLTLHKSENYSLESAKPKRPQEPKEPFPYSVEDFELEKDQQTTFAGTITSPTADGKYPAVILISGSGQQNRDEELFGHKPFKVLADYLTRQGIVVLRFDDLGIGGSKGDLDNLTTVSQADDVEFLLSYLAKHPKVDIQRLGLIGHSEGGVIAPIIAARNTDVKYIVSLAGMAIPGYELLQRQMEDFNTEPLSPSKKLFYSQIYEAMRTSKDVVGARVKMEEIIDSFDVFDQLTTQDTAMLTPYFVPWYIAFAKIVPAEYLRDVKVPVMAVNGAKDVQVIAADNLKAFENNLPAHTKHVFKQYPELNHLFQTATTGATLEYAEIEETFNPAVMQDIVDWIKQL